MSLSELIPRICLNGWKKGRTHLMPMQSRQHYTACRGRSPRQRAQARWTGIGGTSSSLDFGELYFACMTTESLICDISSPFSPFVRR